MTGDPFSDLKRVLDEGPDASRRLRQRARALEALNTRRPVRRFLLIAAAAAAAASITLVAVRTHQPVTEGGAPVALGAPLVATQPRTLAFAEGSTVALASGTTARLDAVDSTHVDVVLERGHLDAEVTKGTGRTWRFHAGAWAVRVVGTQLSVSWDPRAQDFEVRVIEGVVEVTGPGVDPVLVRAGHTLARRPPRPQPPPQEPRAPAGAVQDDRVVAPVVQYAPAPPPSRRHVVAPEPESESEGASEPLVVAKTVGQVAPPWRELLADGRRSEALEAAGQAGVLSRLDTLGDEDILALSDAARLERQSPLARRLLMHVFARDGDGAAEAAFLLGRLEADARHPDSASEFFRRSAALAPDGPFAEQARGRLMEALLQLGEVQAARVVAADYRQRYPAGTWSGTARRLVEGDGGP